LSHAVGPEQGSGSTPELPVPDLVLNAVADTFISEKLIDQNFNAVTDQLLADGADTIYGATKILLAWDLSAVKSCNVPTAANIEIEIFNASEGTYEIFSNVTPWLEDEVTWSSLTGGDTLMGTFKPSSQGSRTVTFSTDGLDIVKNWIESSDNNNGVVIVSSNTSDGIDVEDREQGIAAKLNLTLDSSACTDTSPGDGGSENTTTPPSHSVRLQANNSEKCLDVDGSHDGANVQQYDCSDSNNQKWKFYHQGDDFYTIQVQHSNKCLDVSGPSTNNGANIHQYSCHNQDNQQFKLFDQGGGWFTLMAKHSNKCVDVSGPSTNNGANIHQYSCHNQVNQQFRFH